MHRPQTHPSLELFRREPTASSTAPYPSWFSVGSCWIRTPSCFVVGEAAAAPAKEHRCQTTIKNRASLEVRFVVAFASIYAIYKHNSTYKAWWDAHALLGVATACVDVERSLKPLKLGRVAKHVHVFVGEPRHVWV